MINTTKVWFMKIMIFKKSLYKKALEDFLSTPLMKSKFRKRENQGSAIQGSGCYNYGSFLQH